MPLPSPRKRRRLDARLREWCALLRFDYDELTDGETDYLHERAQTGWITGAGPSAEQQTISRDLAGKLLARLRPEDRVALTLLYEEEWSVAEIGKLLNWSVPKVKMRTYQARNLLRAFIKKLR